MFDTFKEQTDTDPYADYLIGILVYKLSMSSQNKQQP